VVKIERKMTKFLINKTLKKMAISGKKLMQWYRLMFLTRSVGFLITDVAIC